MEERRKNEVGGPGHRRKIYLHAAPFEKESFAGYVSPRASRKLHIQYLAKYLCEIGAKTIIIEKPYYDRHIFRDHWALSADSAPGEEYDCARMHFFKRAMDSLQNKRKISLEELSDFIHQSRREEGEDKGYLGFIVIVLKSEQMIGTTCLAPPPRLSTTIDYPANLVGHSLSIKSLAFREQDKVTSACATCALWSTLQKTSREFGHEELSPGEITARALKLHSRKESLPMDMGLSNEDIASAINSISGLRVMIMNLKDQARVRFEQSREDSGGDVNRTELGRHGSISIKGPVAHDLVFSMAGPWQIEFIQIVPRKLETLKLLALVKEAAEALLKEEIMQGNYALPIIEQIKQYSWS